MRPRTGIAAFVTVAGVAGALAAAGSGAQASTGGHPGDQGADPDQLVSVTDKLGAAALPASEKFRTVVAPRYGQVVRGVSFTPGTRR